MVNYTLYNDGDTLRGSARDLLEQIRAENAKENDEIKHMNVDEYATALIEDATYFLPDDLLRALKSEKSESDYDRALTYLGQMPTSGIRIMHAR